MEIIPKENKMSKKEKTIELGRVMKPNGKPFFSFDSSIKKIEITREYEVGGEKITEVTQVAPNGEYLSGGFINKYDDNIKFKAEKEWITQDAAEKALAYGADKGISSVFSVKVQSK